MRKMKDSKIEWVGEIPETWNIQRIGGFYSLRNEKVSDKIYPPLSVTMKGILPQLETAAKTNDGDNRKLVRKGDFAINSRSDRRGSCGISEYDGSVSLINMVLMPRGKTNNRYCDWLFHTTQFADEFYKWGHGIVDDLWTTRWEDMKKISIPVPPIAEQQRIADFLDGECERIDGLKADIEEQIETLEKYKRSVITEAVTHGLDPVAPMKDSGVPWIGNIPEAWGTMPLYCFYSERKNINIFGQEQNLLSLSYGKIIRKDIIASEGLLPSNYNGYNIVETDDIVIRPTDLQNDKRSLRTGLIKERGIITSAYIALKPNYDANSRYYHYLLHSYDVCKVFYNMGNGVRQGLNYDEFSKLTVLVPPLSEQQAIADYLDEKCAQIDELISQKQSQIDTLETYKKSLIFEYVTGKKEVV